jgi:hypothetical protein
LDEHEGEFLEDVGDGSVVTANNVLIDKVVEFTKFALFEEG